MIFYFSFLISHFSFLISHFSFLIDMSFSEKCEMTNEKSRLSRL